MGVEVVTFGCRLNTVESEAMRRSALETGHDGLVIFNTCAVTAEATRQARQSIRRLKRERPKARIVVTGCAAQVEPERFAEMAEVDNVLGNTEKAAPESWAALNDPAIDAPRVQVSDIMSARTLRAPLLDGVEKHTRAFVQVQNGCDHRCTFCIIPFGRGNSRSVPIAGVVGQVERLVETGHAEIVLTGVDITSYGADLAGEPRLGTLVKTILRQVSGLKRLRLSSIDSIEADLDLIDALGTEDRLMPHLHLSLQSGDDMILKRMKRRHLRADAIAFCALAKRVRPEIVFGADIIAGFPTETDAMFERSLDIVDECSLSFLHVFPFSPRPGTPAARMPAVSAEVVKDRARRLREHGQSALTRHLDHAVGRTHRVLTERGGMGRTPGFTPVRFERAPAPGQMLDVMVTAHDGRALRAE